MTNDNTDSFDDPKAGEIEFVKKSKYLLTDESFDLLRQAQQRINEVTEMTPSLRKLINELVNIDAVNQLTTRIIDSLA